MRVQAAFPLRGCGLKDAPKPMHSYLLSITPCLTSAQASAPDNANAVRGDPLVLLADQALLSSDGEETIKALLKGMQLGGLNIHNRRNLAVAVKAFLISP